MKRAALGLLLLTIWLAADTPTGAAQSGPTANETIDITVRPIDTFRIGSSETRFGPLEFVGGLEMTASSWHFGGLSAFRFLKPGADFIGVADTGFWFAGRVEHDAAGRPSDIAGFSMQRMMGAQGRALDSKLDFDAEGLDLRDGIATVGFERRHRITQFRVVPGKMGPPLRNLDFLVPRGALRDNRGFETVTRAPADGDQHGSLVIVSEKSLDEAGNIFAAILEGKEKGVFTVKRHGDFDITDGAFLPGGDLLLLERRFSYAAGVGMRLRRIAGASIVRGAVVDGPVLVEADMGAQIDNMEGLDVWRRADGATMVSMISDDNRSILQRNLYLEFVLH